MKSKIKRLIAKEKKSIFIYVFIYVLILFLFRLILNLLGYEFYSHIYYISAFIILIIILITITTKIVKCKDYNTVEKVIYPITYGLLQIFIYTIFIFIFFSLANINNEKIILLGNEKYVREIDGTMHPKIVYYKYCGFLIRKNKKLEYNLELE